MASIFKNPLALTQNAVGSFLDQRSVILYEQSDYYGLQVSTALGNKKAFGDDYLNVLATANANELVGYLVQKNELKELFTGIELPYLSDINGFNAYGVSYLDGKVSISSDIAEHPIEDGSVITDAAIIKPITAEVRIVMPTALYTRVYQQIYDYYVKKKKIMLKTKFGMIKNMVIAEMPFELKMEEIDRPVITLSLREIIEVSPENVLREFSADMVANPDDSDTSDNGRRIGDYVGDAVAKVVLGGK